MVTNKPSWKHVLLLACFASSPLATACIEPTVIGGGDDGTGGSGASGGSGATGGVGGNPGIGNNLALFWSEMPPISDPSGSSGVTSGGGGGPDPDTLFVKVSSLPLSCGDPFSMGSDDCETGWALSVNLPAEYQTPGIYQLDDPALNALITEEINDGSGSGGDEVCQGGGGWFLEGTFEVVSIDSQGLQVAITALNQDGIDGTYDVPRCNPLPDDPPLGNSLALRADQFPASDGGDSGTTTATTGGLPDPNMLYVMIGNHALSCGNPYGNHPDCPAPEWLVSVGLPVAYQTPGVYSLSDSGIIAFESVSGPNGDGTCWGGGGSFIDGTIEILAIDESSITVKFENVFDHGAELGVPQTVPRCP